jgi:hypothetical protein
MWDRSQLVGLSISLRSIAKTSYARHCRNTNVGSNYFWTMKHISILGLLTFLLIIPHLGFGQDTLTVDKKKIDKIVNDELKKMERKYQEGYKAGRVTWTFPEKVTKDKLIAVEIKFDGETFLYNDYDPVTYKFMGGIDLR